MPRASVASRAVRTRRRGKKWSPVLVNIVGDLLTINGNSSNGWFLPLCTNANNTSTAPTATVIKCGNFKVSFEIETGAGNYQSATGRAFIMFVPQGVNPDTNWPQQHPEYIMAWRSVQVGGSVSANTIQSRLKRNLNSGDGVYLIVQVWNYQTYSEEAPNPIYVKLVGAVTYVCCAN